MITILHGENTEESRTKRFELVQQAKKDSKEIVYLEGKNADLEHLIGSLETASLFSDTRLVVIDGLIASLRKGKKRDEIISYLKKGAFDADLLLWEPKGVARNIISLKRFKHVSVEECKLPTTIFAFVDALGTTNTAGTLSYFDTAVKTTAPEVVFSMIVRQFRLMIGLTLDASISETKRLAPWQRGKLIKQAEGIGKNPLISHYKQLLTIDYLLKTGRSSIDLTKHIQKFIITLSTV